MKDKNFHTVFVALAAVFLLIAGLRQGVQVFASSDDYETFLIQQYYAPDMPAFDPTGINWAMSDRMHADYPDVKQWEDQVTEPGQVVLVDTFVYADTVVLLDHSLYCAKVRNNTSVDIPIFIRGPEENFFELLENEPTGLTFSQCDMMPAVVEDSLLHPELVVYADTGEYVEPNPEDIEEGALGYTPLLGVPQSSLAASSDPQTGDQGASLMISEPSPVVPGASMPVITQSEELLCPDAMAEVENQGQLCTFYGSCYNDDGTPCTLGPCPQGEHFVGQCAGETSPDDSPGRMTCLGPCSFGVWLCCKDFPPRTPRPPPPPPPSACAPGQELVNGLCLGPWSEKQPDANTYCRPSCVWGTPLCRDIAGRLQAAGVVLGENETAEVIDSKCFYEAGWTWGDQVSQCPAGSNYRVCIRNGNDGTGGAYWIGVKNALPFMSDPDNCGSVGNLCNANQVCFNGSCVIRDPCDGTPDAGTVCADGLVFVAAGLRTTAGNGPPLKWQAAMDYCASLNGGDMGEGWQLPSTSHLRTLFINRNILGGFTKDAYDWNYWSSNVYYTNYAGYMDFGPGATGRVGNFASKNFTFNVRCVRRDVQ